MPKAPRAILFDLDNTLLSREMAFGRWLEQLTEDLSIREEISSLDGGGHACRQEFFEGVLALTGQALDQESFVRDLLQHIHPDEVLIQALSELSQDHQIGLITNGGSSSQRAKLKASGLDQVFPTGRVWISGELGFEKPDPRIFSMACRALGVEPAEALYIGDRDDIDGVGAAQAGLQYQRVWKF